MDVHPQEEKNEKKKTEEITMYFFSENSSRAQGSIALGRTNGQ